MDKSDYFKILVPYLFSWPGIVLIIAIVSIFSFRKQIANFLNEIRQIKAKGLEVNTRYEDKEDVEHPKKEELAKEEERIEEEAHEAKKNEEPKNLDEWRSEMIFASFRKNQNRADEAFKKIQELNHDLLSLKNDEILYLKLSHINGNTEAILKIKSFLVDPEVVYEASKALGFCYSYSNDFENATKFYSQALESAGNEKEKSIIASEYSSSLYQNGKKENAIKILIDVLSVVEKDSNKLALYESLADIYEKENDHENRAFVLDKAVELKPNDTNLVFKAGYAYAESEYDELSLLHYKNAQDINPNDEMVQNNLGVQYDNLKMPIKSVFSYRRAEQLGNTLASANLAYRLMNAGFTEEAFVVLNSAAEKENIHPNVNSALSDLPKRIEKEDEIEREKIRLALNLRKFFLGFIEARFIKGDRLKGVEGEWKSETGELFQISVSLNNLIGIWKEKIISYEYDWKFEGEIFNNSTVLVIYEKNYSSLKREYEYRKKERGFLFSTNDGNVLKFIKINDSYKTKKIYILTRNSV